MYFGELITFGDTQCFFFLDSNETLTVRLRVDSQTTNLALFSWLMTLSTLRRSPSVQPDFHICWPGPANLPKFKRPSLRRP